MTEQSEAGHVGAPASYASRKWSMTNGRRAALIGLCAVLPHLPALFAGFTYDDEDFFVRNQSIRSLGSALRTFISSFPPNEPESGRFRPLTNLSYAVDAALGGGAPFLPHLSNLLLYALSALLLHRLVRALGASEQVALGAALLFAVHPVHCEAVDSIAGRAELLSLVFTLAATIVYVRVAFAPGFRDACLAALLYALAALSKESGLMLPLLLAAAAFARSRGVSVRDTVRDLPWKALGLLGVVASAYFLLRAQALAGIGPRTTILGDAPLGTRIFTVGSVFLEYARLLVWPSTLAPDFYYTHAVGLVHTLSLRAVAGLALVLGLGALTLRALWTRRPSALGLAFICVYLLPVSHLVPFGALMAERFLLLPSVGFVLLLLPALQRASDSPAPLRRVTLALALAVLGALGVRSAARSWEWHDDITLWTPVEAFVKNDARVYNNLARGYLVRGNSESAMWALRRSLQLVPDNRVALNNLGQALMAAGRYDEARASYERTLRLWPSYHVAYFNLAVVELRVGRVAHARRALEAALRENPNYAAARQLKAQADAIFARAQEFIAQTRAYAETSTDPALLIQIAGACRATGDEACEAHLLARASTLRSQPRP